MFVTRSVRKCTVVLVVVLYCGIAYSQSVSKSPGEFWVIVHAPGKGLHYLYVQDSKAKDRKEPRRLVCRTNLPTYIVEIASAAELCNGKLMLQVEGKIIKTDLGERIDDLRIRSLVLLPEKSAAQVLESKDCFKIEEYLTERASKAIQK